MRATGPKACSDLGKAAPFRTTIPTSGGAMMVRNWFSPTSVLTLAAGALLFAAGPGLAQHGGGGHGGGGHGGGGHGGGGHGGGGHGGGGYHRGGHSYGGGGYHGGGHSY